MTDGKIFIVQFSVPWTFNCVKTHAIVTWKKGFMRKKTEDAKNAFLKIPSAKRNLRESHRKLDPRDRHRRVVELTL